jgi:hypothetical protein
LYERKKGEYADALESGFIKASNVVDRTLFFRVYFVANGNLNRSLRKRIDAKELNSANHDPETLDRFVTALHAFRYLRGNLKPLVGQRAYADILPKVYAATLVAERQPHTDLKAKGHAGAKRVLEDWSSFLAFASARRAKYVRTIANSQTGKQQVELKEGRGNFDAAFQSHARMFFQGVQSDFTEVGSEMAREEREELYRAMKGRLSEADSAIDDNAEDWLADQSNASAFPLAKA